MVYTVDEDKVYTFYFSPTKDLASLNAMLLADNYIKIVTKTPTGDIDLLNEGNSLSYEDVAVSAGTSDKVSKSSLSAPRKSLNFAQFWASASRRTFVAPKEVLPRDAKPLTLEKECFRAAQKAKFCRFLGFCVAQNDRFSKMTPSA